MPEPEPRIETQAGGPYIVRGALPLVGRESVETEHGEPIAWRRGADFDAGETYALCRCGESGNRPFCDGTHAAIGFEGSESAPTNTADERQETIDGTGITLYDDRGALCIGAGFCGSRLKNIWEMMDETNESTVRAQIAAMVERCPSGAIRYALPDDATPIEPSLRPEVGVEPGGPLWVHGGVDVHRADGEPIEPRNRVTLCRCGQSQNKPLCDGAHRDAGFEAD
jgi:CDGSH-type Zn-finger protein/ferredoxin